MKALKFLVPLIVLVLLTTIAYRPWPANPKVNKPNVKENTAVPSAMKTQTLKVEVDQTARVFPGRTPEGAIESARFVTRIHDSMPPERASARQMLNGLQASLFVSDCIFADIKTDAAIIAAFKNVTTNGSFVTNVLAAYSHSSETLERHYGRLRENNNQIADIESAVAASGVKTDSGSDLLLDLLRWVTLLTEINEMYGPLGSPLEDRVPNPQEQAACSEACNQVFSYRCREVHKIDPVTANSLAKRLAAFTLTGLSPADLQLPLPPEL